MYTMFLASRIPALVYFYVISLQALGEKRIPIDCTAMIQNARM